jgi:glycosyltransferase involved in cell wall biosynthesis
MNGTTLSPTAPGAPAPERGAFLPATAPDPAAPPVVDVVIPVYNEERDLEPCVRRLRGFLDGSFPFAATITIADNASTDATWAIASRLAHGLPGVRAIHLDRKGRGRALKAAWFTSPAPVVAYMDVDLSTDLAALLPLVAPLVSGHSDVAIGSRLARGSRVVRGPKREIISRCYNLILRSALRLGVRDAQCGFKAVRTDVARAILPLVEDDAWFFDTELLVLAQRAGLRVHEVPVDWTDDPDSRVDIVSTATEDLRGVRRLLTTDRHVDLPGIARRSRPGSPVLRQALTFGAIGVVSTLAYAVLYSLLRGAMVAPAANAVALVVTAVGNTAANRRLTFGVRGTASMARDQVGGLVAFGIALLLTTASIGALEAVAPDAGRALELVVLVAANAVATVTRFLLLRAWISRAPRPALRVAELERIVR